MYINPESRFKIKIYDPKEWHPFSSIECSSYSDALHKVADLLQTIKKPGTLIVVAEFEDDDNKTIYQYLTLERDGRWKTS